MKNIQPTASHFINGEYIEDITGENIEVIYPANGKTIASVHSATKNIIEYAIESAVDAQKKWAKISGMERGRILRRAADIIRDRNEKLSVLETYDTGKPLQETLVADATSGADALEYFAGISPAITGEHIPLIDGDFVYTIRQALGVCVGIGAWNYPTQIACWKIAVALACGNAMIFKPSEITPLGALQVAEILQQAGLPNGVCNVIQGYGDVGEALATDSRIAKVSLTGSVSTGKKVYSAAAQGIKHVTMELGGKSPLIIFDDANVNNAVSGIILGNLYSSGQICSNGTRVFIHENIYEQCVNTLLERIQNIRIGDPLDKSVNFGPLISREQRNSVKSYIDLGLKEGAKLAYGGKIITRSDLCDGFYIEPTVFTEVTDNMTIAKEEIFGPVISLLSFCDEQEVIARANATKFGLASGVFTQDIIRAHRVADQLEAGICYINTYNNSPVEAPFGGTKLSGVGRENSLAAIEHYSERKTVYVAMSEVQAPY